MNTRRRTRRAATIDVVDTIPTKQTKTKKTARSYACSKTEMNNSNAKTEMPTTNESENENETVNSPNSNATEDEDSTEPLFPDSDPSDILAQADLLLAQMDAYALETSSHQSKSLQQHDSDTEQQPSTSAANDEIPEQSSNHEQSTSTAQDDKNQTQDDDSVIVIDDGVMPRPSAMPRSDEDVIFVEEYVKEPPRVTGVVDLCDEDEVESAKEKKFTISPLSAHPALAALAAQLSMPPIASTSSSIVVKCPVCLDSVPNDEVHSTTCGHLFCGPCIKNTVRTRKKCPMCNKQLTQKQIHRIYFGN